MNIVKGPDGKYYITPKANAVEKIVTKMANFGVNVNKGEQAQAEGMVDLAKQYYKEGQKGALPVTKLTFNTLGNMIKGYAKGYYDLATNPAKTITEKPVETFNLALPFASKVMSAKPKVDYAAKSKASIEQLKKGANKSYDAQKGMTADLNVYESMLKDPIGNRMLLDAMADKYGNNPAFGNLFTRHKPQTAGINQLISHEGAPDRARVEYYKQKIANNEKIDPLIVVKEGKKWGIEDGKHRYQAFIESGYNTVPVIVRAGKRSVLRKPNGQYNGSTKAK